MGMWKVATAAALATFMVAGPALAQAMGDEKVKAAQQALKDKGHDPGTIDGKMGPKTQSAIRDFQKAQGMEATGHLDAKTMQSLGMDGDKTSSAGASATAGSASPATAPATAPATDTKDTGKEMSKDATKDMPKADSGVKTDSGAASPATTDADTEKKTEEKK